jgi:hypothetical protein
VIFGKCKLCPGQEPSVEGQIVAGARGQPVPEIQALAGAGARAVASGPVHLELLAPGASRQDGEPVRQIPGLRLRGGHQEQPGSAAGSPDGGHRLDRQDLTSDIVQPTVSLLLDWGGSIGVMADNQWLAPPSEGSELVQVGVLDRLSSVCRYQVSRDPDPVVGVGEDEIAIDRARQRPLQP